MAEISIETQCRGNVIISYDQPKDFSKIWNELFVENAYSFSTSKKSPLIIDGGSHIGMSIIAFKERFPAARIIGFEPDPRNIPLLQKNLSSSAFSDVQIITKALYKKDGSAQLYRECLGDNPSSWGNSIIFNMYGDYSETEPYPIETVRLSTFITEEVDFLKLDIEGCEEMVLTEISDKLHLIRQIELEYHETDTSHEENDINRITTLLKDNNFQLEVDFKNVSEICRPITIERVHPRFAQIKALNTSYL